jgi:hypothetical protein
MKTPVSLRRPLSLAVLALLALHAPALRAQFDSIADDDDAPPPLASVIRISDTDTQGVIGPVPFTPAAHDGVVRSQLRPGTGSYEVPNLDRDASVTFRFAAPSTVRAVGIASSFNVTKRVHLDLLVGGEWVRVRESLSLTFSVGIPVLVRLDHPGVASAVRLTSLDRHLFVDEFTAYSAR